jgi:hypothetical protein
MSESPRPNRKPPMFERCPVCGTEFRCIPGQRWCSPECVLEAKREPLPSPADALAQPLAAFPSWFLRIECERCGKDRMVNEAHATGWRDRSLREILARTHDGCRGQAARAELLTGIEGASSRPVRRIVLREG